MNRSQRPHLFSYKFPTKNNKQNEQSSGKIVASCRIELLRSTYLPHTESQVNKEASSLACTSPHLSSLSDRLHWQRILTTTSQGGHSPAKRKWKEHWKGLKFKSKGQSNDHLGDSLPGMCACRRTDSSHTPGHTIPCTAIRTSLGG